MGIEGSVELAKGVKEIHVVKRLIMALSNRLSPSKQWYVDERSNDLFVDLEKDSFENRRHGLQSYAERLVDSFILRLCVGCSNYAEPSCHWRRWNASLEGAAVGQWPRAGSESAVRSIFERSFEVRSIRLQRLVLSFMEIITCITSLLW